MDIMITPIIVDLLHKPFITFCEEKNKWVHESPVESIRYI